MKHDPKVRRDGRCHVCKGPRQTARQKGVPDYHYLSDPFCSSACARKHYGTTVNYVATSSVGKAKRLQ